MHIIMLVNLLEIHLCHPSLLPLPHLHLPFPLLHPHRMDSLVILRYLAEHECDELLARLLAPVCNLAISQY